MKQGFGMFDIEVDSRYVKVLVWFINNYRDVCNTLLMIRTTIFNNVHFFFFDIYIIMYNLSTIKSGKLWNYFNYQKGICTCVRNDHNMIMY